MRYFTMTMHCPAGGCRHRITLWLHAEQRPQPDGVLLIRCPQSNQPLRISTRYLREVSEPPAGVVIQPMRDLLVAKGSDV